MVLVHLGNVEHGGLAGVLHGLPGLLGAHGDAALGGQNDQAGVGHPQRLHNLTGKVKEAGVIQQVDLAALEFHGNQRRGNGILALDLFRIKVRNGIAVGDTAETVGTVGHKQHILCQHGLAVAAMSQQCNVADILRSVAHNVMFSFPGAGYSGKPALLRQAVCRLIH